MAEATKSITKLKSKERDLAFIQEGASGKLVGISVESVYING